jgi:outer membrane protein
MKIHKLFFVLLGFIPILFPGYIAAQTPQQQEVLTNASLQQVIDYALKNKPEVKQALLDEEIGEREINSALSGWLPQINLDANYNHNLKQQVNALTTNGVTKYFRFSITGRSAVFKCRFDSSFQISKILQTAI